MGSHATELEIVSKLLDAEQLELVRAVQRKTGQPLLAVLLDMEMVDEETVAQRLAEELHLSRFRSLEIPFEPEAALALDLNFARDHRCFPVGFSQGHLLLAMVDPLDDETVDHAFRASGYPVRCLVATHTELIKALDQVDILQREGLVVQNGVTASVGPILPAPVVAFLGYPERAGKTFVLRNLAHQLSRRLKILLMEVGFPSPDEDEGSTAGGYSEVLRFYDIDAHLVHIESIGLVPERLEELAERWDEDETAGFDLVLADIVEPKIGGDWGFLARWARIIILVVKADAAAESCEFLRWVLSESDSSTPVSVGVIINRAASLEHGEASFAAFQAAMKAIERNGCPHIWLASVLPQDRDAVSLAYRGGRLVVDAFPRRPVSKGLRMLSKRILHELHELGALP